MRLSDNLARRWRRVTRLKRPVFLHIPKTGGTYLGQLETDWRVRQPVVDPLTSLGHATLIDTTKPVPHRYPPTGMGEQFATPTSRLKNAYVVTTVRNPFDWLVSYAGHAGGWNPSYCDPGHYDYEPARRSFGELIRAIADREDPWPSRKFLFMQAFSSSGDLMVDWFCRNESLHDDLTQLAKAKRLAYTQRPKQRVGKRRDYRTYYDDRLVDLVYQTWGRELALYGYGFDGPNDDALLHGPIDASTRRAVRYTWHDDTMTIAAELDWSATPHATRDQALAHCA